MRARQQEKVKRQRTIREAHARHSAAERAIRMEIDIAAEENERFKSIPIVERNAMAKRLIARMRTEEPERYSDFLTRVDY